MLDDQSFFDIAMDVMESAEASCADGATLRLAELEKEIVRQRAMALVHQPNAEVELKKMAQQLLNEKLLEAYIGQYIHMRHKNNPDTELDDVEVALHFKLALKDVLSLPMATTKMHYSVFSGLNDRHIDLAKDYVLGQQSEETLNAFLSEWEPWQAFLQKQSMPSYDSFEVCEPPEDINCVINLRPTADGVGWQSCLRLCLSGSMVL